MSNWKGIVGKSFNPDAFDAYVKSLKFETWHPQFVVLHNTGVPKLSQWHSAPGATRMKNLEAYYKGMGWSGGPHLFIADDLIWAFTPLWVPGVHSPSWNSVSWGVEMVGDYTAEQFNVNVRDNTVKVLATLHSVGKLDTSTLKFHKEDPNTTHKSCPGSHVDKKDIVIRVHKEIIARQTASSEPGEHLSNRPDSH